MRPFGRTLKINQKLDETKIYTPDANVAVTVDPPKQAPVGTK